MIPCSYTRGLTPGVERESMDNIEKDLQSLAEALKSNESVARVKVTITLVKPKPSKTDPSKRK